MKKMIILLMAILIVVLFGVSIATTEESSIENYFPMKLNVGYYYDVVQGPPNMLGRFQYSKCVKKEMESGELTGMFHCAMYFQSIKTKSVQVYAVGQKEVFLNYEEGMLGGHNYILRPIILRIPSKGAKKSWDFLDERDQKGETKVVCTSEYVPTLKTTLDNFQNVIKTTKTIYLRGSVFTKEVNYYARDIGLVRIEWLIKEGNVVIDLVKVETN